LIKNQLSELEEKLKSSAEEIKTKEQDIDQLKVQLIQAKDKNQENVDASIKSSQDFEDNKKKQEGALAQKEKLILTLTEEADSFKSQLEGLQDELNDATSKISEKEHSTLELETQLEEIASSRQDFEAQQSKNDQEKIELENKIIEKERDNENAKMETKQLHEELASLKNTAHSNEDQLKNVKKEFAEQKYQLENLKDQLNQTKEELSVKTQEMENMTKASKEQQQIRAVFNKELAKAKQGLDEHQQNFENRLNEKDAELEKTKELVASLQSEITHTRTKMLKKIKKKKMK